MTAGYDDGFMIGSTDGNFSLKLNGQMQIRWIYNRQEDSPGNGADNSADDNRQGFENARTRLVFTGNVMNPQWTYKIQGNFGRDGGDGSFALEDAWVNYTMDNGFNVMVGQMKVPFNREWTVDEMEQLAVERSLVSYSFGATYTQGLAVGYTADAWRVVGAWSDGNNLANTGWEDYTTEYAISARGEWLAMGNWDQFKSFSSAPGSEQGLLVGAGLHYQNQEFGTTSPNDDEFNTFLYTIDAQYAADGWNAFGAFYGARTDSDATDGNSPIGFVIQGGFYFTDTIEAYARYEYADFDDLADTKMSIITVGMNAHYSNNIKATVDLGYALDAIPSIGLDPANGQTGWRLDNADEDGQWVIRTQLQLTF